MLFLYAVLVRDPWPTPFLFVPPKSSVQINCLADSTSLSGFWAIDLASDSSRVPFQFATQGAILNTHGVYELPPIHASENSTILRLLVNDTVKNNGTIIHCTPAVLTSDTTLFVLGKSTIIL